MLECLMMGAACRQSSSSMSISEALQYPFFHIGTVTCYVPVLDNSDRKYFMLDVRIISDAAVVLLVDLRGIAVKSRHDDPFRKQLENLTVHDTTRVREINYATRTSMIARIDRHCPRKNGEAGGIGELCTTSEQLIYKP